MAQARDVIGAETELFVDANGGYGRKQAIRVMSAAADLDVRWFEEPVSSDDLDGLREIRNAVQADVTAGEYGYDLCYFRRMCAAGAVDCLRVAFLTANGGVEQAELTAPWQAVAEAGGVPELIAPAGGDVQAFNHLEKGSAFPADRALRDVDQIDYDALVIPGGVANSDSLRTVPAAVSFVQRLFAAGRPAAVICHGPWVLVEADLVRDRTLRSSPSMRTDIESAGGSWVDSEVQVCRAGPNTLVTSRKPDDLPAFCATFTRVFSQSQPA